jgi:hypothetical protein
VIRVVFPSWRYRLLVNLLSDDDQDGKDQMRGAMLPFEMPGESGQLGTVIVRLRSVQQPPFQPSGVWIEEASSQFRRLLEVFPFGPPGAGESRHQLWLELELVDRGQVLHNLVPVELHAAITRWPPALGEDWKLSKGPVPLFDPQGRASGIEMTSALARAGIRVAIDVRPGADQTRSNPNKGMVAVAVFSTAEFDATADLDRSSLGFGKTGGEDSFVRRGRAGVPQCTQTHVNGDGLADLVCRFRLDLTGLQSGDTEAVLRGRTLEGLAVAGSTQVSVR